jgi:hypothetical protein
VELSRTNRNLSDGGPFFEHLLELAKEVFPVYMSRADADSIDIGPRAMDSKTMISLVLEPREN